MVHSKQHMNETYEVDKCLRIFDVGDLVSVTKVVKVNSAYLTRSPHRANPDWNMCILFYFT